MCFAQKAGSNVEAEVEGFTVVGLVVVTQLGALVGVEHLLVDDAGGGENRLAGELTEFTGVIPCNKRYFIRILCGDLLVLSPVTMLTLLH